MPAENSATSTCAPFMVGGECKRVFMAVTQHTAAAAKQAQRQSKEEEKNHTCYPKCGCDNKQE